MDYHKKSGYDRNIVIVNDYIKTLKGDLSSGIPLLGKTVTFREYLGHQFGRDNMRFDVVMGNPPYQESNGGGGKGGGSAIWQLFVNEAKQLSPIYICMITPSRWFTGGKGLAKFQRDWLQDEHIDNIYHYDNATALFPGTLIAGGVSYFIWNRDKQGNDVNFTANGGETCRRKLNEFDVFVTDQTAADIIKKINSIDNGRNRLNDICMDKYYYGIKASYICRGESDLRILSSHGYRPGRSVDVDHQPEGYRVITSSMTPNDVKAPFNVLNPVQIIEPDVVPEAGYITFGGYKTLAEAEALKKYLNSKFARLLIRLRKIGVNANVKAYKFVPLQDFTSSSDIDWSASISDIDKQLYKKYNLSQEEIDYIDRTIKPMA